MRSYVINIRRIVNQLVWVDADSKDEAMKYVRDWEDREVEGGPGITAYGDLDPVHGSNTYRFVKDN